MGCIATNLEDAKLIKPKVFADKRGFFLETWRREQFDQLLNSGKPLNFIQDNHSMSVKHVLRGLHMQHQHPQGKLVRAIVGEVYDVIVDLRLKSPTFGQWQGFYLSSEDKSMLWIPPGFAHGFYVLSERAEICYKCSGPYYPNDDYTLMWNDPDLAIDWPLAEETPPSLSDKDSRGMSFKDIPKYKEL